MDSFFYEKNKGFTLIELIIVITIVSILAAVALPRFINAQQDARAAKASAIFGSIRSAAALAKSRCELDAGAATSGTASFPCRPANATSTTLMDGLSVDMVYGYPAATAAGIGAAAQINPTSDGLTLVTSGTGIYYDVTGGTATQCSIFYAPATLSGTTSIAPVISIDKTSC